MSDWIGLGVIVLILIGAFIGLARLGAPPEEITPEEFERRVEEARGTMRAGAFSGMYALQKLMNPRAAEAVETLRDLKAGHYDVKQQQGDDDPPEGEESPDGEDSNGQVKTDGEGTDA
jgi:hypothetical protein